MFSVLSFFGRVNASPLPSSLIVCFEKRLGTRTRTVSSRSRPRIQVLPPFLRAFSGVSRAESPGTLSRCGAPIQTDRKILPSSARLLEHRTRASFSCSARGDCPPQFTRSSPLDPLVDRASCRGGRRFFPLVKMFESSRPVTPPNRFCLATLTRPPLFFFSARVPLNHAFATLT